MKQFPAFRAVAHATVCLGMASATLAQPARGPASTTLPDGRYACQMWIGRSLSTLGYVDIRGKTYRGPSQSPSGGYQPMAIDAKGRISWSPTFSQISKTGGTVQGSRVSGTAKSPAFSVDYTTARGYRETIDCTRQ